MKMSRRAKRNLKQSRQGVTVYSFVLLMMWWLFFGPMVSDMYYFFIIKSTHYQVVNFEIDDDENVIVQTDNGDKLVRNGFSQEELSVIQMQDKLKIIPFLNNESFFIAEIDKTKPWSLFLLKMIILIFFHFPYFIIIFFWVHNEKLKSHS